MGVDLAPAWGLGIGSFKQHNNDLLLNWLWCFIQAEGALWRRVVDSSYGAQPHGWLSAIPKEVGCWWFDIARNTNLFLKFMSFKANNGRKLGSWGSLDWGPNFGKGFPWPLLSFFEKGGYYLYLGFRRGLSDKEASSWSGLINQLDSVRLGDSRDGVKWNIDTSGAFKLNPLI